MVMAGASRALVLLILAIRMSTGIARLIQNVRELVLTGVVPGVNRRNALNVPLLITGIVTLNQVVLVQALNGALPRQAVGVRRIPALFAVHPNHGIVTTKRPVKV